MAALGGKRTFDCAESVAFTLTSRGRLIEREPLILTLRHLRNPPPTRCNTKKGSSCAGLIALGCAIGHVGSA
jgi:hypothetical protein